MGSVHAKNENFHLLASRLNAESMCTAPMGSHVITISASFHYPLCWYAIVIAIDFRFSVLLFNSIQCTRLFS